MASKIQNANKPLAFLLFKLQSIQYRNGNQIKANQTVYFSFSIEQQMYFSSSINAQSNCLSNDILVPIFKSSMPQFVNLCRWENHTIMFNHQIDISELRSRKTTKKKYQTKAGQILSFFITVLNDEQLKFGDKYLQSITQHYLLIESLRLKEYKESKLDQNPSYFLLHTSSSLYIVPVSNGQLCILLPQSFIFQYYRNGKIAGKSRRYNSNEIQQSNAQIGFVSDKRDSFFANLKIRWCINLYEAKVQNTILLQAHQLFIYDIEVKFDSYNEFNNAKVKFVYGSKGFEIGNQSNTSKQSKIKKIIYFIIKSQEQQVSIVVEKNVKTVGMSKFFTDEITSYIVHNISMKMYDNNNRAIGTIKFKCEKAKTLSTPHNNKFWKENDKKKGVNSILLSIQQFSVQYDRDEPVSIIIKTGEEQKMINQVPNMQFFSKNKQRLKEPFILQVQSQENIYLMLKQKQPRLQQPKNNDFVGIAVLNFSQLRLGANSTQILFFKNQQKTATANCIINKVIPYPFIKPVFQPQMLDAGIHKTISFSVVMNQAIFTPFFNTYKYDNKTEVYCIIEVNKMKKVLIMENSQNNSLYFTPSASSDNPVFYTEQSEYMKVKIIFLVSDLGTQQQIYGGSLIKIKFADLIANEHKIMVNKNELKNDFGTIVGQIGLEINMQEDSPLPVNQSNLSKIQTSSSVQTGPFKSQIRRVKNSLHKVNQNISFMEQQMKKKVVKSPSPIMARRSQEKPAPHYVSKPSGRYNKDINSFNPKMERQRNFSIAGPIKYDLKLPIIPDVKNKKNNLKDLVNMMKIRKRDSKGQYEQNSALMPFQPIYPTTDRNANYQQKQAPVLHNFNNRRNSQKLEKGNSNSPQNGNNRMERKQSLEREIKAYEQKLRGLKNVLSNINQIESQKFEWRGKDKEIRRSLSEDKNNSPSSKNKPIRHQFPELEDNQFARMGT